MENKWIDVKFPPKNMREVWIRTGNGSSILGHYNYSKRVWYDHASYNPVTATGWQEVEPGGREEYALLEAENAQLKEAIAVYQRNEKFDIRDIRRLKRTLWLTRANNAEGQFLYWCARFSTESGFTKADIRGYSVNTKRKLRTIGEWIEIWKNVKLKAEGHMRTHYPKKVGA